MVSIIVPIYNTEKYLKRCIRSIIEQSYKEWELILVDDGSTDDSGTICKEFEKKDNRIRYFFQENNGVSSARNLGITKASGKYISFVDSDDSIMPNMLETLTLEMEQEMTELVFFNYQEIVDREEDKWNPGIKEGVFCFSSINKRTDFILDIFLEYGISFAIWNKMYVRSVIDNNNIKFDEDANIGEDIGFNLNYLFYVNKIKGVPDILYKYWRRDSSAMGTQQQGIRSQQKFWIRDFSSMLESVERHYLSAGGTVFNFNLIFIKAMDNQYYKAADRRQFKYYVGEVQNRKFLIRHTLYAIARPWRMVQLYKNPRAKRKWKDNLYILKYLITG